MKAYSWRRGPNLPGPALGPTLRNFGDEITPLLLDHLNVDHEWSSPDQADLVVTGSVLEQLPKHYPGTVCGAGKMYENQRLNLSDSRVFALRGKLTLQACKGLSSTPVLGDPGLLVSKFVRQPAAKYDLGVLPHWRDNELFPRFSYGHYIDPKWAPELVIQEIASCKRLVSSSLHGVIVADAYGIPRQAELPPLAPTEGGDFKFRDYSSVFDTHPHFGQMWSPPPSLVQEIQDALLQALQKAVGIDPSDDPLDPQVSILVPFRDDGEHRSRVWRWLRRYWRDQYPEAEIIQGWCDSPIFSKTQAVNNAYSLARGRNFLIMDADTYLPPQVIRGAAGRLDQARTSGLRKWFMAYTKLYRLNEASTLDILLSDPSSPLPIPPPRDWEEPGTQGYDGGNSNGHKFGAMSQMMPREAFELVEGMDPKFEGWGCCDEETQILTKSGWKRYHEVSVGDQVLTLNHQTGVSEWNPVQKMNVYQNEDGFKMLSVESKTHSSLTTMDHRWPVFKRDQSRIWRTTETLNGHDRVPISAVCSDLPKDPILDDSIVELVAWLFTEGSIRDNGRSVNIAQSHVVHPEYCGRIEDALVRAFGLSRRGVRGTPRLEGVSVDLSQKDLTTVSALASQYDISSATISYWCRNKMIKAAKASGGGRYGTWLIDRKDADEFIKYWRSPCWWRQDGSRDSYFYLSQEAGDILLAHAPDKIPSFEFLLSLTQHQLDLFIEVAMSGDGATSTPQGNRRATNVFEQKDPRAAEAFAFAVILSGRGVSIRKRNQKAKGDRSSGVPRELDYQMTVVNVRMRDRISIVNDGVHETVVHGGIVWCPTTRNGSWLARRDGKVYFTGNSEDISMLKALDTLWGQNEVLPGGILHLWHAKSGKDNYTRKWVGQSWAVANSRLAQRYALASGEPAAMQGLCQEHKLVR